MVLIMKKILNLYKMLNKNNTTGKGDSSKTFMFIIAGVLLSFIFGYVGYKFADSIEMMGGVPIILSVSGLVAGIAIFAVICAVTWLLGFLMRKIHPGRKSFS